MAAKKSVKKVEISDDNVLDLKGKKKADAGFTVHKIQDAEEGRIDVPIERYPRSESMNSQPTMERQPEFRHTEIQHREPERAAAPTAVATENALMDRSARPMKYDPEQLHQRMENFAEKLENAVVKVSSQDSASEAAEAKELIKVKFDKFVTLVASRDFLSVMEKNRNEDIVLSSNLLTDLAGAVEEKSEKKTPVIFLVGLAIGVIITYLLINH